MDDDADRLVALGDQRARCRIGREALLGDDRQHALARFLSDVRGIVDDARNG